MSKTIIANPDFLTNASTVGSGKIYNITPDSNSATLEFKKSTPETTFTATVEAVLLTGNWKPITIFKVPEYTILADISDDSYFYEIDLTRYTKVRVTLTAISGGTVSCFGRVSD